MDFDRPEPAGQMGVCLVCDNKFETPTSADGSKGRCPYCQTQLGLPMDQMRPLDDILGLRIVRVVPWDGPGVYYEAERDGTRLLVTLLSEDNLFYTPLAQYRDKGDADPYRISNVPAHPNVARIHPVIWHDKVAAMAIDYIDGHQLGDWLPGLGPLDVPDAVCIVLKCLHAARHIGDRALHSRLHPDNIEICSDGQVKTTAFTEPLISCFRPRQMFASVGADPQQQLRRLARFTYGGCVAPEYQSDQHTAGKYSADELVVQNIFSFGGLLYELLSESKLPSLADGQQHVKQLELVPINELRSDAPSELVEVISTMTAYDPAERYQTYDEAIAALESLRIAPERVGFVHQDIPLESPAEQAAKAKRQWISREGNYNFRRIKWGMTIEEVWQAEIDVVTRAMPAAIFVGTEYQGLKLTVLYSFEADGNRIVCNAATINPEGLLFSTRRRRPRAGLESMLPLGDLDPKLVAQLRRMVPGFKDMFGDDSSSSSSEEDVNNIDNVYKKLKELIRSDYGEPLVEDGPLLEDLDMVEHLSQSEGISPSELLTHCKTSTWESEHADVYVSIRPSVEGHRIISATVLRV